MLTAANGQRSSERLRRLSVREVDPPWSRRPYTPIGTGHDDPEETYDAGRVRDIRAAARSALPVGPAGSASTKWKRSGILKRSSRFFAHSRKSYSLKLRSR